ncbi:hypothetical protein L209DRAFT_254712 [Thermothelomyces heterothallicus CBS 203.75]
MSTLSDSAHGADAEGGREVHRAEAVAADSNPGLVFPALWCRGWSISPTFTYYSTVNEERAPAFRMIRMLSDCVNSSKTPPPYLEELTEIVLTKVLKLFQAGRARR